MYLPLNRGGRSARGLLGQNEGYTTACGFTRACESVSRCARRVILKQRRTWVHFPSPSPCLYLLRYVKPDASIIQSTALRRSRTCATLLCTCYVYDAAIYPPPSPPPKYARTRTYTVRRGHTTVEAARVPAPGYSGLSPGMATAVSRDTDVTSRVKRRLDTFRNMRGKISFFSAILPALSDETTFVLLLSLYKKYIVILFHKNDVLPLKVRRDFIWYLNC